MNRPDSYPALAAYFADRTVANWEAWRKARQAEVAAQWIAEGRPAPFFPAGPSTIDVEPQVTR